MVHGDAGIADSTVVSGISLVRPVHFVCSDAELWPELRGWDGRTPLAAPVLATRTIDSVDCWIIRTYYELRLRGADVTISGRARPGAINLCDVYRLGRRDRLNAAYVVIPRADGHPSPMANFLILQNNCAIDPQGLPSANLPHWPQPGIIPRSSQRGEKVAVLAFKGARQNLDARFGSSRFREELGSLGVSLQVAPDEEGDLGRYWADYSECDVVFAVRNLTEYDAANKPASKLVNAWFGEVPAILGPEPAYLALRRSELDFFVVRSEADVIEALRTLIGTPGVYSAMIANARQRREEFTDDVIARKWASVLNGPVARDFDVWRNANWVNKAIFVIRGLLAEPEAKKTHRERFLNGPRILDSQTGEMPEHAAASLS